MHPGERSGSSGGIRYIRTASRAFFAALRAEVPQGAYIDRMSKTNPCPRAWASGNSWDIRQAAYGIQILWPLAEGRCPCRAPPCAWAGRRPTTPPCVSQLRSRPCVPRPAIPDRWNISLRMTCGQLVCNCTVSTLAKPAGVALNSKGDTSSFLYTRRTGTAQLFEFDQNGKMLRRDRKRGSLRYLCSAHVVRIDKGDDNIWCVDEGSNMVIEFTEGHVIMTTAAAPSPRKRRARPGSS